MIKIDFEMEKDGYKFRDAIHLPEDHVLTDAEIEAIKQERFYRWYTIVTTPQPESEVVEGQ